MWLFFCYLKALEALIFLFGPDLLDLKKVGLRQEVSAELGSVEMVLYSLLFLCYHYFMLSMRLRN
jgi:hypothetical protein